MKIDIITSALPPKLDGIGDYTAQIAAELAKHADVRILTGQSESKPISRVVIEGAFSSRRRSSIRQVASRVQDARPDWVLLQYNPFSYGRWGLNIDLPATIAQIKRKLPGTRIAVMFHEPFVRVENWQFCIMTTWQRWQLWSLGRSADILFFSIEAWARQFQRWFPAKPVVHLPVVSNIPEVPISRGEARSRLGIGEGWIVVGMFGTVHVSRMVERLRQAACAAGKARDDVLVLYMGPNSDLIRQSVAPLPVIADGPLDSDEVSRRFPAIDIYVTAFVDGVSTRRGSLMTGLQHGAAILGTQGHLTDQVLRQENGHAFLLADADSVDDFERHAARLAGDESLRARLGEAARDLYEREFAAERTCARLAGAFGMAGPAKTEACL